MGIFTRKTPTYVPPIDRAEASSGGAAPDQGTLLGGAPPASNDWLSRLAPTSPTDPQRDASVVRVADRDSGATDDNVQVAQQRPIPPRPIAPPSPPPTPAQLMARPGRGYGDAPHSQVEGGMSADQKRANRAQALYELARQPPVRGAYLLPDDWEKTKPSEVVDDIKRAAQRHGVPTELLARLLYQEGKFNEPGRLPGGRPLVTQSSDRAKALGWVQMTTEKFDILKNMAHARGDTTRVDELNSYSPADRAKAFDAAAELLAYQHRLLGSWHASVAAYNIGENFVNDWLNGLDRSDDGKYSRDPSIKALRSHWRQMRDYLGIVLRGSADEPPSYKIYDYRDPEANFRVPPAIPRSPNTIDPWRIPRDARENP